MPAPSQENDRIAWTAALARLELAPEEVARLDGEFEQILEHFAVLMEVDVEGIEPLASPFDAQNVVRADEPRSLPLQGSLLAGAPEAHEGFFSVPKTIGGER